MTQVSVALAWLETRVGGLPVGVQVLGSPLEGAKVFAVARWVHENVDAIEV